MDDFVTWKPGMIVVTQGDPNSIISKIIRRATGSNWTHGFVVLSETEGLEAVIPRVQRVSIKDRLAELKSQNRDYVVMDLPNITDKQRILVANSAIEFVGRYYDILGCLYFSVFKVWKEGTRRMFCSRLMTAPFYEAIGIKLFEWCQFSLPKSLYYRRRNLLEGYALPHEVLRYSELEIIYRTKRNIDII